MERRVPTKEEVLAYLKDDRNWGRWGDDDQVGAVNMVTPEKRAAAAKLVKTGRAVSLSREFPKTPAPDNPNPAIHYMKRNVRGESGGSATDFYGIAYHGQATTHLDALCHVWDGNGMWNGRNADDVITFDGAIWGSVEHWKEGIITRGVLLDVPKHRGQPFVTHEEPIHGWELEDIAKAQGVALEPGDAIVVYGGRDAWNQVNPIWGSDPQGRRPGLHASCLKFLRESDCCLLVWDMMDFQPNGY
ncbi:MAG: cyclase family protein, partial [Chloroflexi bacterium]|nr:cyclase family protein [Chloroflexota bacterium]